MAAGAVAFLVGLPVARWLRAVTYRKPDEEEMPHPGSRWWVAPALAVSVLVLTWRVIEAPAAQGVGPGSFDPGVGSGREFWVRALVLITFLVVALAAVCLAAMDFDVHRLPDRIMWPTLGTLITGLLVAALVAGEPGVWGRVLLSGLACATGYLMVALVTLARGSLAIGLGDVKLAALLGAGLGWFGWWQVFIGMYGGVLVGGLYALYLVLTKQVGRGGHLAYGPPMMVGALLGAVLAPGAVLAAL